jgi:hypothetical protein
MILQVNSFRSSIRRDRFISRKCHVGNNVSAALIALNAMPPIQRIMEVVTTRLN